MTPKAKKIFKRIKLGYKVAAIGMTAKEIYDFQKGIKERIKQKKLEKALTNYFIKLGNQKNPHGGM